MPPRGSRRPIDLPLVSNSRRSASTLGHLPGPTSSKPSKILARLCRADLKHAVLFGGIVVRSHSCSRVLGEHRTSAAPPSVFGQPEASGHDDGRADRRSEQHEQQGESRYKREGHREGEGLSSGQA